MGIPGESLKGVYSANEFLTRINLMKAYQPDSATPMQHGKKRGGGGRRQRGHGRGPLRQAVWARKVTIVYRRTEAELPARKEEVEHAKEEGIQFTLADQSAGDSGGRAGLGAEHPLSGNGAGRAGRFRPPPSCAGGGQRDGAAHGLRDYGAWAPPPTR